VPRTLLMPIGPAVLHRRRVRGQQLAVLGRRGAVLRRVAFVLEENGFPVAPAILGVVLGTMLEENFITSMIKSDGSPAVFFTRPIAGGLAIATFVILFWPVGAWAVRRARRRGPTGPEPKRRSEVRMATLLPTCSPARASELERLQLQSRVWEPAGEALLAELAPPAAAARSTSAAACWAGFAC
jgi:hypothetical protein